jgi:hypothetical protein
MKVTSMEHKIDSLNLLEQIFHLVINEGVKNPSKIQNSHFSFSGKKFSQK